MDRREALRTTSFVVGYTLSAAAVATALPGCKTEPAAVAASESGWSPAFFNQDQLSLIADLAETLLPETSTPGAKSVLVHQYIDDEAAYFLKPQDQYRFLQGLKDIESRAQSVHGKSFSGCTAEERTALLNQLEQETRSAIESGTQSGIAFFTMLKGMTFRGYFTSEKVGKEVLVYDPIPEEYLGCIPLQEGAKLWSL